MSTAKVNVSLPLDKAQFLDQNNLSPSQLLSDKIQELMDLKDKKTEKYCYTCGAKFFNLDYCPSCNSINLAFLIKE